MCVGGGWLVIVGFFLVCLKFRQHEEYPKDGLSRTNILLPYLETVDKRASSSSHLSIYLVAYLFIHAFIHIFFYLFVI